MQVRAGELVSEFRSRSVSVRAAARSQTTTFRGAHPDLVVRLGGPFALIEILELLLGSMHIRIYVYMCWNIYMHAYEHACDTSVYR